ncbi:LpqB family beta-propeller domain-containing protein [Streptomyces sp. NPDC052701]|uniref:LpqB family beta-propeller domain-containing protein n=1 Tax=Streptomyces sp. NPDC052701 TaxID=3155533 RepID=UPI003430DAB8
MGADREGARRRTPARAVAYVACGGVLLAGCASMPDSGGLRGVESTPRLDSQVRVFAMPPAEDATPPQIVQGFLEALTSDDPHYKTARQYLTPETARTWRPELSTTVLMDGPGAEADSHAARQDAGEFSFTLTGTKVATVDAHQSYAPATGPYGGTVHLKQDKKSKQWRIDALPQGVVMGRTDFQRNYMSVSKYYFASNTGAARGNAEPMAVADPVYVRKRVDPLTQIVRSLLDGPTSRLAPVVRTSFPAGTALREGVGSLTPDDRSRLTVPLNDRAAAVGRSRCEEMAAQLLFTLRNLTPAVEEIDLRAGGGSLCSLAESRVESVASRGETRHPDYLYFVDAEHRLVRIAPGSGATKPDPVPGALGADGPDLRSVAVSRDEHTAAGVTLDGRALYVGSMVLGGELGEAVLTSGGGGEEDRLTAPSWDAQDDLWVADRDPGNPRLLLLEGGRGEPLQVRTPGIDGRIQAVRVAADGVRIALVVEKGDKRSLVVGLIERAEEPGRRPTVTVVEPRSVAPELEQVTAMSWAGDSRLVVVGREHGGVEQMRYVQVDGSTPDVPAPAALTGVKDVTASGDERLPLVAYSVDGIVRLPSGAQWQKVTEGTAPVYPG